MLNRREDSPQATELSRLYDRAYFYGETSGYAKEGYPNDHPDWSLWLDLIQAVKPSGVLLDLGCAYGYLVSEAIRRGYRAIGLDVSTYALSQAPAERLPLILADTRRIPLPDRSIDVVTLFDVIEHVPDPELALEDIVRLLKTDGLLVLTTPDPLFFDREESTHFSERPPSFWIAILRRLGLEVQFRFSEVPFNFQLLAWRNDGTACENARKFRHDYFSLEEDIVRSREVTAIPRWGWGALRDGARVLAENGASLYVLNEDAQPRAARIRLSVRTAGGFSTLRLRFDDWVLRELYLNSEKREYSITLDEVLVPSGGHHLFFDLFPGAPGTFISDVEIQARPIESSQLVVQLPFDIYQRYQCAAEVVNLVRPVGLLDVGGCIGESNGHWATSSDFFGNAVRSRVLSSDSRQCDQPDHVPCDALDHPFGDHSFDMVVSMDVLEHIPPALRTEFVGELDRLSGRWILLGAPFGSPDVEQAEQLLSTALMKDHVFLSEHRSLGLPDQDLVAGFAGDRQYRIWRFANASLENWVALQSLNYLVFSIRDARSSWDLNRLYSREIFPHDHGLPCYRYLFLIYKGESPLEPGIARGLDLLQTRLSSPASDHPPLAAQPGFQTLVRRIEALNGTRAGALSDAQFLANARDEHVALLLEERESLIRQLKETPLHVLARQRWREKKRPREKGEERS